MAAPAKVRVGVVGVGKMGRYHLDKYRAMTEEVQLVGFYDSDTAKAGVIAAQTGVPSFADLGELLFEVDAVTVASPTHTHAGVAFQALESGVHVLIEKPIASSVAEAESLVRLARSKQLVLQVGMVERFRLAVLAKDVPLQPVRFLETHRLNPHLARESYIDVVSDLMIHDLDLALSLMAEDPITVSAIGMRVVTEQDDLANVRLEFPSGAVMNLNASRVSADPLRKMRVFSDQAYASFDFRQNTASVFRRNQGNSVERLVTSPENFDALLEQARDFVACVREGRRPLVNGEDGLRALKYAGVVLQKIREREGTMSSDISRSPQAVQ
jgi:predicted dehydrogenase